MWGLFSHRKGLKSVRVEIQTEGMDDGLKNRLWSALYTSYFRHLIERETYYDDVDLAKYLWLLYFKYPIDRLPSNGHNFVEEVVRKHFYHCVWHETLDLIEAVLRISQDSQTNVEFAEYCNLILQSELYGYRLVKDRFVKITSEEEIVEIESAIKSAPSESRVHLTRSLEHLSDRESPDYRNSIKESISAVETLCCLIAGKQKASLGEAVNLISKSEVVNFHPAFAEALKKLYGWTNDADGIRHSLMEESSLSQEDARFMLVSCSTFTNYLIVKADKAGIPLSQ